MSNRNSLIEFYLDVCTACYTDVATMCHVPEIEYTRDLATLRRRTRCEGLSFLTKTLPLLGKALDRALSKGERLQFERVGKRHRSNLPRIFGWLFSRIFDHEGWERRDASPHMVGPLRQLLFVVYKLELPYNENIVEETINSFVAIDDECHFNEDTLNANAKEISKRARKLVRLVTSTMDLANIVPAHGPGVVSTGQTPWKKKFFNRVVRLLETEYPFAEYFFFNKTHLVDRVQDFASLESVESGTAKVVLVPKDSRGPRLISCEPLENQWIQQGQMKNIVQHLETHRLTRGQVNFTSQEINRFLALTSSLTGKMVTLDMKEASDRVSLDLVRYLFHDMHYRQLCASRSTGTELPNGTIRPLNKFAPMGSAVCFPVEALVFWALSVSTVMYTHGYTLEKACSSIYVYGDDIVCRSEHHAAIMEHLPMFGLMLNKAKCCTAGSFRESCGCDAYKGVDVTPTKLSSVWYGRLSANVLSSYVEYSNAFHAKGYYNLALLFETRIKYRIPYTACREASCISYVRPDGDIIALNRKAKVPTRFSPDVKGKTNYCRYEALGPRCVGTLKRTQHTDWEELLYRNSTKNTIFADRYSESRLKFESIEEQVAAYWANHNTPRVHEQNANSALFPTMHQQAGTYAVPHRNRLQWGWAEIKLS